MERILEIYGEDIDQGEYPHYNHLVAQKELFGAQLSFKNINGDQMMTIFTRKLFTNKKLFQKLIDTFIAAKNMTVFEEQIKALLYSEETKGVIKEEKPPAFGFKTHLVWNEEE